MADKNFAGRSYLLYAATSAPSDATAASDYTLVGDCTASGISRSRNAIDISTKDDGDDSTFIAGRRNWTVSLSGNFDHTLDAGVTLLEDAWEATDGIVYFLLTSTNAGDREFHGQGKITQFDTQFDDESASTFSATIQGSGTLSSVDGTTT